jgi:tetratricopeptide (TPR) repeat protein
MSCQVSREQLWSWVDRDAPELAGHLAVCASCRTRAAEIRSQIGLIAADTQALTIPLPERIGTYTIKRLIGEGGQALVYEAEQASPHRAVAVKVLKGGQFIGRRELRRFQREIQALAALNHPGIATIYEAGQSPDGQHYLAMELVQGTWLHVYLREKSPPRRARLELFQRILNAVQYAHRHGVVHLDLKPTNILIDEDGNPKVLDFGLARLRRMETDLSLTETYLVEGTPRYMSPEQICARREEVDARADVYALGAILYEMLTGRPPHDVGALTPDAIRTVCEEAPARPSALDRSLRGDLETIMLCALEKAPTDRYPSVAALAADVNRHLHGEAIVGRRAAGRFRRWSPAWPRIRWGRRWWFAALAALALLAALGLVRNLREADERLAARRELAVLNCKLFHEEPDPLEVAAAIAAPDRIPRLMDAVLVAAHGNMLAREYRFATEILREGLAREPSAWPYRALLSEINTLLARPQATELWNEEAEAEQLATAEDWYLRSLATLDRRVALRCTREAVRRDPRHRWALLALTQLAVLDGDYATAADGAAALEHMGEDVRLWKGQRADFLTRLGRYTEALGAADSALAMTPDDYLSHYRRAVVHRRLKHYKQAADDFTRGIDLTDRVRSSWLVYHRGTMHWLMGRREEAVADYRRSSNIFGFATYGTARMVLVLRELGREDEADSALAEARRGVLQDDRLATIFSCLAGEILPAALVAAADPADLRQQCEACFYAAEMHLAAGQVDEARELYHRCIATGVRSDPENTIEPMSEYELAEWRLKQLASRGTS